MKEYEVDREKHIQILNSRRNREPINCIEIGGGRYNITKKWLKLIYLPNKHKFERPSLLWKVSREILTPILVDIDINTTDKPSKNVVECYMRIIGFIMKEFTNICSDKVRVTATRRTKAYQKKNGKVNSKGEALFNVLEDYKKWLFELRIVDPACGSGAFLNQALSFLIKEHKFIDDLIALDLDRLTRPRAEDKD